ncbi:C-N hydrolase family amidase [Mariniflexile rhizosphaerae]|uniref:carbon-nitrogen hydrolase family protein n=1 Tax=unclassified Mariniflexile TaxID=2643887 RepID=UPI000CC05EC6|nr:carbon-nitrogen hydrolase family protein [Mariniflexile sp. TRM1-10]AXP79616.1 C-N hydrolase family amidase [Mariniflexile sp. TRM1-10]PLB18548.1 MAG: Carbon-nitrogen hydrolase [Flavobacteriaceae bacterium FS1-H7996/R]
MKISVAQTKSIKGDISANIETHKKLISLAILYKVDTIFFPELSVTGYEPELAKELATNQDNKEFDDFQEISNKNRITIGIGMPTNSNSGIKISMIIFHPNSPRQTYSKQQLHSDEFPYFVNGEKQIILTIDNKKIAPAICYESLQTDHSDNAKKLGAEIYVASVAKSQNGIDKAMKHYPEIAQKNSIPILMSNCIGYCDNFLSVGQTSVWTKQGKLIGQLNDKVEGILVFDTETEEIIEQTI